MVLTCPYWTMREMQIMWQVTLTGLSLLLVNSVLKAKTLFWLEDRFIIVTFTQVQKDGALLISEAGNSDHTMFTCIGTNGFNSAPKDIEVIVASMYNYNVHHISIF